MHSESGICIGSVMSDSRFALPLGLPLAVDLDVFRQPLVPLTHGPVIWASPDCAHFSTTKRAPLKTSAFRYKGRGSFKIRIGRVGHKDVGTWATVSGWHDAYLTFLSPRFPIRPPDAEHCRWEVIHPKPPCCERDTDGDGNCPIHPEVQL